ncbi:hypothetical protein HIM_04434 [Hirsutella minnesotensis 3608]|uniref:Cytidyltransferase-like domain-containing protein n=1 Tax=Hirsutella minnesotensis 3608 TaxID=1043627 RepID=A0A0F7ZV46_9HYPO|nr:hypothetical protein HIM_04434 [Hirsutella minnesotensis 3608]
MASASPPFGACRPPSLLLLPAPPHSPGRRLLRAAYRAPLDAVLSRLTHDSIEQSDGQASVLVVALAGPILIPKGARTRTDTACSVPQPHVVCWNRAQALLANTYAIVASICAERDIAAHLGGNEPGSIDVRIVLVHRDGHTSPLVLPGRAASSFRSNTPGSSNGTIVLDLSSFADSVQPWETIFHTGSEQDSHMLAAYLALAQKRHIILTSQIVSVGRATSFLDSPTTVETQGGMNDQADTNRAREGVQSSDQPSELCHWDKTNEAEAFGNHQAICLGGTFDHLHLGHKLLLEAAALLLDVPGRDKRPCTLIIGISGDELLAKKKYAEELQPWEARARCVITFLSAILGTCTTTVPSIRRPPALADGSRSSAAELRASFREDTVLVRCVDIRDPFGPTISEEHIDAIVVSGETRSGGTAINEKRTARGWRPLAIYEIDVLDALDVKDDGSDGGEGDVTGMSSAEALAQKVAAKISSTEIRKRKAERQDR